MHGEARLKKPVPVMWSGRTGERERAHASLVGFLAASPCGVVGLVSGSARMQALSASSQPMSHVERRGESACVACVGASRQYDVYGL